MIMNDLVKYWEREYNFYVLPSFYAYFTYETVGTCTCEMTLGINLRTFESPVWF